MLTKVAKYLLDSLKKMIFNFSFLNVCHLVDRVPLCQRVYLIIYRQRLDLHKIFECIEIWYRKQRSHSYLAYQTIEEFNNKYLKQNINNVA